MYKRSKNINGHEIWHEDNRAGRSLTRHAALTALKGSALYAARVGEDVIKIGFTNDLAGRVRTLAHYNDAQIDVLAIQLGSSYEEEQEIHASLEPYRARGREYYHPTPEVLAIVNAMRDRFGLPHIAA